MKLPAMRPIPAQPQMVPMPLGPRLKTISPKMLKRIWAAPPPVAQPTEMPADAEDEGAGAHVAKSFAILVPGAHDLGLGVGGVGGAEAAAGEVEARDAEGGNEEGGRVKEEGQLEAELGDAAAAEKGADRRGWSTGWSG